MNSPGLGKPRRGLVFCSTVLLGSFIGLDRYYYSYPMSSRRRKPGFGRPFGRKRGLKSLVRALLSRWNRQLRRGAKIGLPVRLVGDVGRNPLSGTVCNRELKGCPKSCQPYPVHLVGES